MMDRVESKRFDPGKVCTYPGRLSRGQRGLLSMVSGGRAGWLCALVVPRALVVVRFLGELFVLPG